MFWGLSQIPLKGFFFPIHKVVKKDKFVGEGELAGSQQTET